MDIEALIHDPELVQKLEDLKAKQKRFSDITDDEGLQYVDLVMEGGGMLGLALVGYTWVLEQAGIRFLGVGGTSAGSINAVLLAALDVPSNPKSPMLLREMEKQDFSEFMDGDEDSVDLIKTWLKGAGKVKLVFKAMQVIDTMFDHLGLNRGNAFQKWIAGLLGARGITTLADLRRRMNTLPKGLRVVNGEELNTPEKAGIRLALVAADVSTETKVIFPDNAELYFKDIEKVNPAVFVRASMSIPYFFRPLRIDSIPRDRGARGRWKGVGYDADVEKGGLPKYAVFVDGGIMSNFPLDIFHDYTKVPEAPTFGVKLEYDNRRHSIESPFDLAGAIFNSARHCLDYDFLKRNPEYRMLMQFIPCQKYNWLDFDMGEADKAGLFKEGALMAIEFLDKFDWQRYKEMRMSMIRPAPG